ncbi:MAG TPA: thioesterase family protein [Stellaceae bacterium]|nr:thioesterase family protein [Stellaceae bacterium]
MAESGVRAETYRSVVAAWECDVMGHLTIAYYFDRFTDAAFTLIERLNPGMPPAAAWRTSEVLVRYQRELRAGDGMVATSGIIGGEGEDLAIGHELVEAASGEVATLVEHRLAPRTLPYGGSGEMRRALVAAATPWSSPGFEPLPEPAPGARVIDSGRDRVKTAEVDERGELLLSGYVHRFAHACLFVCGAFGMTSAYMREQRRGFSTFETRLHLVATPPGAGDGVAVTSRLLAAGKSSLRLRHELRRAKGGELLAVFHQSGVHFDLEARRSAPLPPALREAAQALLG